MLQRVTVSLDEELAHDFDALIHDQGYQSRSEAVRDLVRHAVEHRRLQGAEGGFCVASFSYVYDHEVRSLPQRLAELQHQHHDVVVATTHVHLDHASCLEAAILRGSIIAVRSLADAIRAERGVRFAEINLISVNPNADHGRHDGAHRHGPEGHATPHRG